MQRKPWKAGITTGAATSPDRGLIDPNASPTRKIDVLQSPRSLPHGATTALSPLGGHEDSATSALAEKRKRSLMKTKSLSKINVGLKNAKHAPKSLNKSKSKVSPGT